MTEIRPARAIRGGNVDIGRSPDVGAAVGRGIEHLERLRPPERRLPRVGQSGANALAGDRVGNEHDPPFVSRDEHTTVRDARDVEVDEISSIHPPSFSRQTLTSRGVTHRRAPPRKPAAPKGEGRAGGYPEGMRVCLASTSPARLMLLRQAGIEPETLAPDVDEDAVVAQVEAAEGRRLPAPEHVLLLARRKAADVARRLAPDFDGLVIGGDSMFALGDEILGKPHTVEAAISRWNRMRGATGVLHSGHSMIRVSPGSPEREVHATAEASVTFVSDITDDEVAAYVATGEPLHVAGAFTVDSLGGAFIERIDGAPSTVVGMSLSTLRFLARELDVAWPSLWNRS